MCGIIGYIGKNNATTAVLDGLKRLEYRGYDSVGIASLLSNSLVYHKRVKGRVDDLLGLVGSEKKSNVSIGHNRWATHGRPSVKNAHPHFDCGKKIFLAHNGIIENYGELKEILISRGHKFRSDTDTEVAVHLVEDFINGANLTFEESVRRMLKTIKGAYAFVIINSDQPNKIIAARNSSPLMIGLGDQEFVVASDASAILPHTNRVVYLNDGEFAVITSQNYRIANLKRESVDKDVKTLEWTTEDAQKRGHPHFMLKEILEEPEAVENATRGRLVLGEGTVKLGGLEPFKSSLRKIKRIIISACGTARNAGLVGEYMIEEYAEIPVEVEYASEFRHRKQIFNSGTAFLAISQSGETADTLASLREAKRKGLFSLGITNVVGSTISREIGCGIYNHAGLEIGVASTKAFVSQLAVLSLLAVYLGRQRKMSPVMGKRITRELSEIASKMRAVFRQREHIREIAKKYAKYDNFLFLGRKYNAPIASEGALKLKEISYIHAEGYSAGEMKHGPIAMIDKNFPSVVIALNDSVYEKNISSMEEIKARGGKIIAIATNGDKKIEKLADDVIFIPKTLEMLTPLLSVLPLHFLAYYIGVLRGRDVDKPRNLAKSVTVE